MQSRTFWKFREILNHSAHLLCVAETERYHLPGLSQKHFFDRKTFEFIRSGIFFTILSLVPSIHYERHVGMSYILMVARVLSAGKKFAEPGIIRHRKAYYFDAECENCYQCTAILPLYKVAASTRLVLLQTSWFLAEHWLVNWMQKV